MAYSNYGAKVYCDDEPKHENCDATIKQVLGEEEAYVHYMQHFIRRKDTTFTDEMCHGIVGDKDSGVVVGLYKSSPSIILVIDKEGTIEEFKFEWDYDTYEKTYNVNGIDVRIEYTDEPDGVECRFVDRKGRVWKGKSAYCYGEGHQDWGKYFDS